MKNFNKLIKVNTFLIVHSQVYQFWETADAFQNGSFQKSEAPQKTHGNPKRDSTLFKHVISRQGVSSSNHASDGVRRESTKSQKFSPSSCQIFQYFNPAGPRPTPETSFFLISVM